MLIEQTHFPLSNDGNPKWRTILFVAVIIVGTGYLAYKLNQPPKILFKLKTEPNDKQ